MRQLSSLILTLILAVIALPAAGQAVPSAYDYIEQRHSLGIFGGYLEIDPGEYDLAPDPAPFVGARYGIRLAGPLLGNVEIGVAPSSRTVFLRSATTGGNAIVLAEEDEAVLMTAEAGLFFQLNGARTWHGIAPFVGVAGGAAFDLTPGAPEEGELVPAQLYRFGPTFAARASVGTDFFVTERLSIRADVRDHLWRLENPSGLIGATEDETDWTHNFGFTLGSAFHF